MKYSYSKVKNALKDIQTTYRWSVQFVTKPANVEIPEDVEIRIQTSNIPTPEVNHIEVEIQGHKINYPGKVIKSGELEFTFIEGTDAAVIDVFLDWMNQYWSADGNDTQGKQASAAELKADVIISLLDNQDQETQSYKLVGCLPKPTFGGELGQDPNPMNPSLTLTYDDFHPVTKSGKKW